MQQQMQLAAQIHAWMSAGGMTCTQVQAESESLSRQLVVGLKCCVGIEEM